MKTNKEQLFISAVILLHEDEDRVVPFLTKLTDFLRSTFLNFEIILVNNFSQDKTIQKIQNMPTEYKKDINLIHLAWKHNRELAILSGTDLSIGDLVYEFENLNINYSFDLLTQMYQKALSGFDIVSISPEDTTNLSSRLFYKLFARFSYLKMNLSTEQVRIVSRRTLNYVLNSKEKTIYRKALYQYSGYPSFVIKYKPIKSSSIMEHMTIKDKISLALDVLISFSTFGTNIIWFIAFFFLILSILGGIYALVMYILLESIISGWTTMMLFLSFGLSGIFFVLSIIGKYLSTILYEVQKRPYYTIRTIERFTTETVPQKVD